MQGVVALDADDEAVRGTRAVLAVRGLRVLAAAAVPPGTRGAIRVRRVRTTTFDGYEVVVAGRHSGRKIWAELRFRGSEGALIDALVDFLERLVDPSPKLSVARSRRRAALPPHGRSEPSGRARAAR